MPTVPYREEEGERDEEGGEGQERVDEPRDGLRAGEGYEGDDERQEETEDQAAGGGGERQPDRGPQGLAERDGAEDIGVRLEGGAAGAAAAR